MSIYQIADRHLPQDFACELDAIEPGRLRMLGREAPKVAEDSERQLLNALAKRVA
jgi:hypothetical protein